MGRKAFAQPKVLERLGITVALELWGLVKALHGCRQSPSFSDYRDDVFAQLQLPDGIRLCQGRTVRCWWSIGDSTGEAIGVLIVYVDDFMLCGGVVWHNPEAVGNLGTISSFSKQLHTISGDGAQHDV